MTTWISQGTRERIFRPLRVIVYGPDGVGKTAFAMGARGPLYRDGAPDVAVIPTESGADAIGGSFRFPRPESWDQVIEQLTELEGDHPFKKLVIDSVDWLEALARDHVCAKHKKKSLDDFGYNRGPSLVYDEMRALVMRLEGLRETRGMHVIGVAHSTIRNFKNPEGENFDRFELKLQATNNASVAGLWREWPDYVLFANWETLTNTNKDGKTKGVAVAGDRVLYTQRTATYDAKSRVAIPERLPLDWLTFAKLVHEAHTTETKK